MKNKNMFLALYFVFMVFLGIIDVNACVEQGAYATITSSGCASTSCCDPPSSYWGCPPALGGGDPEGYLGKCVCTSTWSSTNYYCPLTSCSVACSPNSIVGCSTSCGIDIGLRIYDGTQTISVAVEPLGTLTSPLRVRNDGNTYGIILVDTGNALASKIRVKTSSGIKAIKKLS